MARRPLKPCAFPACGVLMRNARYCEKHAKQNQQAKDKAINANRPSAAAQGYGHRWRKARAAYLDKNPLCAQCQSEQRVSAAEVVDHIKPHCGDKELFWNRRNWQPLCKTCHSRKTASSDGGFGNRKSH